MPQVLPRTHFIIKDKNSKMTNITIHSDVKLLFCLIQVKMSDNSLMGDVRERKCEKYARNLTQNQKIVWILHSERIYFYFLQIQLHGLIFIGN